jgi:hypothetical protein
MSVQIGSILAGRSCLTVSVLEPIIAAEVGREQLLFGPIHETGKLTMATREEIRLTTLAGCAG